MSGVKQPQSIDTQVLRRIRAMGRGCVVTPSDFAHLGSAGAVHLALARHAKAGEIRRLARGLYDFPRHHPELGELAPDLDRVVEAVQRRDRIAVMASGELAANQLGLSGQVPMRAVYLSSGRSKRLRIGRREIRFVQRAPREMATAGRPSATVIQALHYLGEERVDESVIAALRRRFTPAERLGIARDARHAPDWVAAVMRRLAAGESVADA